MNKIGALWRALQAGEQLANSATWKNRQIAANAVLALLGLAAAFMPQLGVSHDDMETIAAGIAVIGGVLNAALTTATSRTVGLSPASGTDPEQT